MAKRRRGRRNFGVTVDDDRWESFMRSALKLGKIEMRVGILRAGNKYPAGWVGTKSRINDTYGRFQGLKEAARQKAFLAADSRSENKSPGYSRKAKRKAIDVAKVAAVVGWQKGKRPKLPTMWNKSMDAMNQQINGAVHVAMKTAIDGGNGVPAIERLGAQLAMAYKADVIRSGHTDTRRLLNAIKWEIVDVAGQRFAKKLAAARRKARKLAKGKK
jgi:hypothetical protein